MEGSQRNAGGGGVTRKTREGERGAVLGLKVKFLTVAKGLTVSAESNQRSKREGRSEERQRTESMIVLFPSPSDQAPKCA